MKNKHKPNNILIVMLIILFLETIWFIVNPMETAIKYSNIINIIVAIISLIGITIIIYYRFISYKH